VLCETVLYNREGLGSNQRSVVMSVFSSVIPGQYLKIDRCYFLQSRDGSVGIALGYGLDDRGSRV
jgi:hypothetical protein